MGRQAARFLLAALAVVSTSTLWAGEWIQLFPTTSPPARYAHGIAYDEARGRLVLFGGTPHTDRVVFYNDTWEWDGTTWTQILTPNSPPGRQAMYMAYDSHRNVVVLYGGSAPGTALGDTWEYDGTDWTQVFPANTPGLRSEGAMTYDRDRGVMVLYGGHTGVLRGADRLNTETARRGGQPVALRKRLGVNDGLGHERSPVAGVLRAW